MNDLQTRFDKIMASPKSNPLIAEWDEAYKKGGYDPAQVYWDALGSDFRLQLWIALDDTRRRQLWDALDDVGKEALLKLVEEK
jgi:hypothetical protein